ncbi:MAG: VOC family protein [Polyangiaceae bacterium]|nr:VOC family protein [Polyangiaceae bacterium]
MPNAFAHIELATDDVKAAKKFYKSLFDWNLNDLPAMSYTMIDVGGGTGGGMAKKQMPEQPTAWLPYVEVADVKKTLAKAAKAGAKVVLDYQEIGEMGAIGVFVDPMGAGLGIWQKGAGAPPPPATKTKASKKSVKAKAPAEKPVAKKASAAKAAPAKAPAGKAAPAKGSAKKASKKR